MAQLNADLNADLNDVTAQGHVKVCASAPGDWALGQRVTVHDPLEDVTLPATVAGLNPITLIVDWN